MPKNENYDTANAATIDRWRRQKESTEDRVEHMTNSIKKAISKTLKDSEKLRGVARDLKEATNNRNQYNFEGGYGVYDDGDIITGFEDYTPNLGEWDDD